MKQLKLILAGCGDRGSSYLKFLQEYPDKFKLVAVAEPVKSKRDHLGDLYGVPEDMRFESFEDLFALPKVADIAMICTQDRMHFAPAMMAIEKKYDLLLEKPAAPTPQECYQIAEAAKKNGVRVLVCHVLRYTPFYKALKKFLDEGHLGEIMNIVHEEGVGNIHMSHSFVRGNWRNTAESAPMILAKCCHDTDLLQWLVGDMCTKVQSMGTLSYFTEANKPEGAPARCTDGCPHEKTCLYHAPTLYKMDIYEMDHWRPVAAGRYDVTVEEMDEVLKTSPYGRCAYQCDNDVVDHQIVTMQFGDHKHATLTMSAFNKGVRVSAFMGTKGELRAYFETQELEFFDFETRETTIVYRPEVVKDQSIAGGHGGGDFGIMEDLYEYIANNNPSTSISSIDVSCMSHLICFAAEEARAKGVTVDMEEYIKTL